MEISVCVLSAGEWARGKGTLRLQVNRGVLPASGDSVFPARERRCGVVGLEIPGAGGHTAACGRRMGEHGPMILRSDVWQRADPAMAQSHKEHTADVCESCTPVDDDGRRVEQPGKKALTNRVRRIEGQVGGILNMIENDRYCVDILTQISAIKSALDGVSIQILSSHANGCVRRAVQEDGGEDAIDELLQVVRRMMR